MDEVSDLILVVDSAHSLVAYTFWYDKATAKDFSHDSLLEMTGMELNQRQDGCRVQSNEEMVV